MPALELDYQDSAVLSEQYFIDDSELNVKEAKRLGVGHVIHYVELSSDVEKLKSKTRFRRVLWHRDNLDPNKIWILNKIKTYQI